MRHERKRRETGTSLLIAGACLLSFALGISVNGKTVRHNEPLTSTAPHACGLSMTDANGNPAVVAEIVR